MKGKCYIYPSDRYFLCDREYAKATGKAAICIYLGLQYMAVG